MITAWILYAIGVGALLGAGALALERLLRTHGLPSRWIWAGTIPLSMGWPLGHWAWENRPRELLNGPLPDLPALALPELPTTVLSLEPLAMEVSRQSILRSLDSPVMVTWALATGVLLLFFIFLLLRTHHLRSQWRTGRVGGQNVLYSDEWGPAVVGLLRPQIVLPRWCRDIDEKALQFILDHELEHVRAGDVRLMILAGMIPVLFPWHLPVWWQLARLRTAVEGDCDLRVLGRNPGQTRAYVDLLLDVGRRATPGRRLALMLSEPFETLKRRIKIMTMPLPKGLWIRGGLLVGAVTILVALACWAPGPTDSADEAPVDADQAASLEDAGAVERETVRPVFIPYSVRPDVKNRGEVFDALERGYLPSLKEAGIGGTIGVWFYIDEEGQVRRTMVDRSSGHLALDEAALRVADVIEFTPALNRDQRRPVWVSVPIVFTTGDADEVEAVKASNRERVAGLRGGEGRAEVSTSQATGPVGQGMGQVTGTTASFATEESLADVQVYIPGIDLGGLTNRDGRFLLLDVPEGDHEVVAHLIGYGRVSVPITVRTGDLVKVKFDLRLRAVEIEPLIVRGSQSG